MPKKDPNAEWIRGWSKKWVKWQTRALPPRDQHSAIVQELLGENPGGSWHRAILIWPRTVPEENRTAKFWIDYLCSTTTHRAFLKPRMNDSSTLSPGVQLIYTRKEDLTPLLLTYPDAVENVREFDSHQFEQFIWDNLDDWQRGTLFRL